MFQIFSIINSWQFLQNDEKQVKNRFRNQNNYNALVHRQIVISTEAVNFLCSSN